MFLMWLGGEESFRQPCATKERSNVFVANQGVDMLLNDGAFVDPVVCLAAGDGRAGAGVDTEFEAKHRAGSAVGVESIPV
jgi:hypothetical protein